MPPVGNFTVSNYNSVPDTQMNFAPSVASPVAALPVGTSVMDENMVTLRDELQKMFYDNFGI